MEQHSSHLDDSPNPTAEMGNAQSGMVYRKLEKEIPPVKEMGYDHAHGYIDKGPKIFSDDKDREQFIYAVITVATSNGLSRLDDHDFKLLYSRRGDNTDRFVARIVAIKDSVIRAKIEPEADGADQVEAFKALKKDIEIKLDRLMSSIPDHMDEGASSSSASKRDDPPAYSGPEQEGDGRKLRK